MSRHHVRPVSFAFALLAAGCAVEPPFARTNPMDSGSNYDITLLGPDSIHSLGERFSLTVHSDPPYPPGDYELSWAANPHVECVPRGSPTCDKRKTEIAVVAGEGEFEVIDARADYRTISVFVHFGRTGFAHQIAIGQKVVALDLSCSRWALPFDPCDDVPFDRGSTITLHPHMQDARTNVISRNIGDALERGRVFSRDSSVVTPLPMTWDWDVIRLDATGGGATWVIVQVDEATDSIRVAVAP